MTEVNPENRSSGLLQDLFGQEPPVLRAMPPDELDSYLAGLRASARETEDWARRMADQMTRREAAREALSKAIEAGDMDIPD